MSSKRSFAIWVWLTVVLVGLATFRKARSHVGEPPPPKVETTAAAGGGGLTAIPDAPAPPASRSSRARRPADPGRGADPGHAPALQHVVETAHYRVSTDVSKKVCEEAAALLEHAWPIWCARFDLDESYDAGPELLPVRIWEAEQLLERAISSETGDRVACLGYVPFNDYRLFACRGATEYESRRILLHEGMHQFLYRLIGSRAARNLPRWYDEGCAHESEKHVLDGERLELFQHTGGTFSNQIEKARLYFEKNGLNLAKFVGGSERVPGDDFRACGWAIVHFMRTGAGPEQARWFAEFEAMLHSGRRDRCEDPMRQLSDPEQMAKRLVAFLDSIAPKPESR